MILRRDGLMTSVNILRLYLPNYCFKGNNSLVRIEFYYNILQHCSICTDNDKSPVEKICLYLTCLCYFKWSVWCLYGIYWIWCLDNSLADPFNQYFQHNSVVAIFQVASTSNIFVEFVQRIIWFWF